MKSSRRPNQRRRSKGLAQRRFPERFEGVLRKHIAKAKKLRDLCADLVREVKGKRPGVTAKLLEERARELGVLL